MGEGLPFEKTAESPFSSLKKILLSGEMSLEEVRDELLKLDQATPTREASDSILSFLLDPEVRTCFEVDAQRTKGYKSFLSFIEFHVAQRCAFRGAVSEAIVHTQSAVVLVQDMREKDSWRAYLQGTSLYLQGKIVPEEIISLVEEENNKSILKNLNDSLKRRGSPVYQEDYRV